MSKSTFTLSREIAVEPSRLRELLADLHSFSELHPLIESIETIPARDGRSQARFYRVVDIIPVGPFRLRTTYVAALEVVSETEVVGDAWQSPGVRLHTVYTLQSLGAGTLLTEHVEVQAPFGLRRFVAGQAERAHAKTLDGIKALLEA